MYVSRFLGRTIPANVIQPSHSACVTLATLFSINLVVSVYPTPEDPQNQTFQFSEGVQTQRTGTNSRSSRNIRDYTRDNHSNASVCTDLHPAPKTTIFVLSDLATSSRPAKDYCSTRPDYSGPAEFPPRCKPTPSTLLTCLLRPLSLPLLARGRRVW